MNTRYAVAEQEGVLIYFPLLLEGGGCSLTLRWSSYSTALYARLSFPCSGSDLVLSINVSSVSKSELLSKSKYIPLSHLWSTDTSIHKTKQNPA